MKKVMKPSLIIILFLVAVFAKAQLPTDTAVYKISYLFKHMTDTSHPSIYREENMALYLGKRLNEYSSVDQFIKDSIAKKRHEQGGGFVVNTAGKKTSNSKIFTSHLHNNMAISEFILKRYVYDEPYPKIDWQITNEVKTIEKWNCTKAEGVFKGRTYEAWFTTEISATGGPWKLVGLPGIILEAYDSKKQVQFLFAGFKNNTQDRFIIQPIPEDAIKTTKTNFLNMKEAAQSDPMGFINAAASDISSGLRMTDGNSTGNYKRKKQNNPIELNNN